MIHWGVLLPVGLFVLVLFVASAARADERNKQAATRKRLQRELARSAASHASIAINTATACAWCGDTGTGSKCANCGANRAR